MMSTGGQWRRSSRSGPQSNCVELSTDGAVRDSKNPTLTLPVELRVLINAVKADRLSR